WIKSILVQVKERSHDGNWLYQRPKVSRNDQLFYDLLSYAPGLNSSDADLEAVVEAEAVPNPRVKPGQIEGAARRLLARARKPGWQALTVPAEAGQPAYTIFFDGRGRYTYERNLPTGLHERVVCDGKTLLHLYPQLGLAARRSVSRFHRADFAGLVPWALAPADDLARGADVSLVGERTVAVIPHGADTAKTADGKPTPYLRAHLVSAEAGRLPERQVVRLPKGEVLLREICTASGTVRVLDDKGKELLTRKGTLAQAQAPDLKPDTKGLVVVPLPHRTP